MIIQCTDRQQWLEERRKSIGGSDAPVLFGESPWASPFSLWYEKVGLVEQSEDFEAMKPWLKWGQKMEKVILEAFIEETGRMAVLETPYAIQRHDELSFMHASIDAWQAKRGIAQLKNVSAYKKKDWLNGVPRRVEIQCQHEMFCSNTTLCSVAILINGSDFLWCDIERDNSFINDELIPKCRAFWQLVETETQPEVDAHPATEELLKHAHPQDNGEAVQLPIDYMHLHDELQELQQQQKETELRIREIKNRFRAELGDNTYGYLANGDHYSFKAQFKDAYTVKPSTSRVLRYHERKV